MRVYGAGFEDQQRKERQVRRADGAAEDQQKDPFTM